MERIPQAAMWGQVWQRGPARRLLQLSKPLMMLRRMVSMGMIARAKFQILTEGRARKIC